MVTYRMPLRGKVRLTTPFGKSGSWKAGFHTGIDLVAEEDRQVYPIASGKVESINAHGSAYGNHVTVRHADNKVSLYAHLARIDVRKGDLVDTNDRLGEEGATGNVTGRHLHLEVHQDQYRYPAANSKPSDNPWLLNPATLLGIENKVGEVVYVDDKVSDWAKDAEKWVKENGISDGERPKDFVTREEVWTMLYRLAQILK